LTSEVQAGSNHRSGGRLALSEAEGRECYPGIVTDLVACEVLRRGRRGELNYRCRLGAARGFPLTSRLVSPAPASLRLWDTFLAAVADPFQGDDGQVEAGALGLQVGEKFRKTQATPHVLNCEAV